jgi:hypothetical protein
MTLTTGSPIGSGLTNESLYLEGAPDIFIQDYLATPLYNPDAQGYYWGISGTVTYPYIPIGCAMDVSLHEDITMNDVRCDTVGVVDTIQKRNFVEFQLTFQSMFPLTILRYLLKMSPPDTGSGYETMGIPQIDNSVHYHIYAPKVYDEVNAQWLMVYLHRAKIVDAFALDMPYGANWKATGLKIRAYADTTKPAKQLFGVIKRFDSTLP